MTMQQAAATATATILLAIGLAGSLTSQSTTWVVDANNGPGTHFTDLPPAVAAAAPGDIVVVRYVDPLITAYTAPTIDKALTVVSEGGRAGLVGPLVVQNLPAGEDVVLRGLRLAPFATATGTTGSSRFVIWFNDGSVHLQDCVRDAVATMFSPGSQISNSSLVTFTQCSLPTIRTDALRIDSCGEVVLQDSAFMASNNASLDPAISVQDTRLVLQDSTTAGRFNSFTGGGPAISSCSATIEVAGASASIAAVGVDPIADCLGSSTTVTVAPGATVNSSLAVPGPVFGLGGLVSASGQLDLDVYGHSFGVGVLSFGLPTATPVPLWDATYYLDISSVVVFDALLLDVDGRASWQAQLPAGLASGTTLWLQAASIAPGTPFQLTTPAVVTTP
ncbi:MAG: hypothetical protein AB8H80_11300 [Planctomycetota bacterium]